MDCIFCKIAKKEISKEFLYEDENIMVFPDIHPAKPIHLLIVPKRHIPEYIKIDDLRLHEQLGRVINKMILQHELVDKGYRIVVNGGGAQIVDHLHFHLMGPMGKAVTD